MVTDILFEISDSNADPFSKSRLDPKSVTRS